MAKKQQRSVNPLKAGHVGMGIVQTVFGLFTAGSVFFGANQLFLWYYAREVSGVMLAGVNDCVWEDSVANGDLLEGQTFCNKPENLFPTYIIYERHWQVALVYFGLVVAGLLLIGWLWLRLQQNSAPADPTGQQPHGVSEDENTI